MVDLEAGVVGDQGRGLVQRSRRLAVAVRLDPSGGLRGDGEQLREGAEDAVLAVVVVVELAQDLRDLLGAGIGGEFVLDLLEGELRDADAGACPVERGAGGGRSPGGGLGGGDERGDRLPAVVPGGVQVERPAHSVRGQPVEVALASLDGDLLQQYRQVRIFRVCGIGRP